MAAAVYNGPLAHGGLRSCEPLTVDAMKAKLSYTEAKEDEWPICPYCKQELRELKFRRRGWLTSVTAFWCPHCRCLLSTSTTFNG
jgi:hypothetical protein